jgi:hypothetical protein
VSKRCCPVCSELLNILRDTKHPFRVRGRHPTVFPVDLPPWLPRDVLLQMIARFRCFLLDEIKTMMSPKLQHKRTSSEQSLSAMSNGSHMEDYVPVPDGDPLYSKYVFDGNTRPSAEYEHVNPTTAPSMPTDSHAQTPLPSGQ